MNEKRTKEISRFLSFILRHNPQSVDLHLDENGWAGVEELLTKSAKHHHALSLQQLVEVVATNDKQRFTFNDTKNKIRASQGHSIDVELNLDAVVPPEFLYHGTVAGFLEAIKQQGLKKMKRRHVHLSADKVTAEKVGSRRGKAIILKVFSGAMHKDGFKFYLSANGVWLTDNVPALYIDQTFSKEGIYNQH